MTQELFEKTDDYIGALFAEEDETLRAVEISLRRTNMPLHSVSATQGKLLYTLALLCKSRRILEIGTLGGYSTIWLARALPTGGKLISLELDAGYAAVARENIRNAGLSEKVDVRVGKALELLPDLETEAPFDMVFIDADKPPYAEYFEYAHRLSRPGGLIIADNVIREGRVLETDSGDEKVKGVQRFNQMLADRNDVTAIILQTIGKKEWDGMAIAVVDKA
ncbi:MAG TPA: O-methyltransferase, partial [Saprospiraceae bacterium]|nr:O-methyltransferase [Saprospiraceae bacterium]